jgi:hypothetical protein
LGSQAKAGWASARNEHIYFFGKGFVGSAIATVGRGLLDVRAATPKTIFVKLHVSDPIFEEINAQSGESQNNNCAY